MLLSQNTEVVETLNHILKDYSELVNINYYNSVFLILCVRVSYRSSRTRLFAIAYLPLVEACTHNIYQLCVILDVLRGSKTPHIL